MGVAHRALLVFEGVLALRRSTAFGFGAGRFFTSGSTFAFFFGGGHGLGGRVFSGLVAVSGPSAWWSRV